MVKWAHIFLLFLKINENNLYLFSKNCSLFHLIFKKLLPNNNGQTLLEIFKNSFLFLKTKKKKCTIFKSHDQTSSICKKKTSNHYKFFQPLFIFDIPQPSYILV